MKVFMFTENTKRMGTLFGFVLIVLMIYQIVVFREYALEAAWLHAKEATRTATLMDQKKLGFICNSRHRINCSHRVYRELVSAYPGDMDALSSYATVLVGLKKYQEAEPYFTAYFAGGGGAEDVMYWYAKSLRAQGLDKKSIPWFYNILYYNYQNELATQELFEVLHLLSRSDEAQSLLAALQAQTETEEMSQLWQKQFTTAAQKRARLREVASQKMESEKRLSLPALDGRHFYLPIKMDGGVAGFINSIETEFETIISQSDLAKYDLNVKKIATNRVRIESLHVGPFELTNFEASLCDNCESVLGGKLLSRFSAHVDGRGKVPYLIMHEGEE